MAFELVDRTGDRLGEGILWHPGERALWWVDFYGPTLHRLDPAGGKRRDWRIAGAATIGALAFASGGRLVLALDRRLDLFEPLIGRTTPFAAPEAGREGMGMNDAKVGRDGGTLWAGSFDEREAEPRGVLWRLAPDGSTRLGESGFTVCNGPAFSPDGRTLYFSDSVGRRLLAYELRPDGGLGPHRVLATLGPGEGMPDGIAVDAAGRVWCARYGGGAVTLFAPDGARLRDLPVPVRAVTSCCLGGPDLATLFVATGEGPEPLAGSVFAAAVDVPGLPEPLFDPQPAASFSS